MPASVGSRLAESDRRYFGCGAVSEVVAGARILWLPGFATLPAGCVVVPGPAVTAGNGWLHEVEDRLCGPGTWPLRLRWSVSDVARRVRGRWRQGLMR